jgi:proline dehydrogenase
MEGTAYTEATVDLVCRLHAQERFRGRIGVVIQSYLRRSEADIDRLLGQGIRIRLCKGAYQEPPNLAFPAKSDVDQNFVRLMQKLLPSGVYHGIATHDEKMIEATTHFAAERGIGPEKFEFQMLYGVRRDLQKSLLARGYRLRVYIPFGAEWYPYFMRRLAERPANLLFMAKNLFRK